MNFISIFKLLNKILKVFQWWFLNDVARLITHLFFTTYSEDGMDAGVNESKIPSKILLLSLTY